MTLHPPVSHYLLTADQSRDVDRRTIEETGISGFTLMEVAGSSAAKAILTHKRDLSHGLYLCGKGNNAGDALVVARYLSQHEVDATVVFLSGTDDLSGDAQKNRRLLQEFAGDRLQEVTSWAAFDRSGRYDFIIDGMLGTGLNSEVRSDYHEAVQWANDQAISVFAMDIPTGLHADSGQTMGVAIRAEQTFAFGGRKQGFYLQDGPGQVGSVTYCELPFPNKYKSECQSYLLDESWMKPEPIKPGRHKYASGVLYVIAGSEGLTGAAILAARSAWAEGLGAVILICPRGLVSVYEHSLPSVIKKPVGESTDLYFAEKHVPEVQDIISQKEGALLFGPGLGRNQETVRFTGQFLSESTRSIIIDADGLWCLARLESWNKPPGAQWMLTPHPGELARLTDQTLTSDYERLDFVRKLSSAQEITVLSKGMPGIVGTSSGECYITNYNTRYFARAGSGDVLAGKVGAYRALGYKPAASCTLGLLRGKQKLDHYLVTNEDLPEPTDFI